MAAIKKLPTKISGKFDAEVLLHRLETMAKDNVTNHWNFTTLGAMIGGAIVCLFLLFCSWRVCCHSGPATRDPAPLARPTQPTIFNMMVDPNRQ
jgi:hypothetical protein